MALCRVVPIAAIVSVVPAGTYKLYRGSTTVYTIIPLTTNNAKGPSRNVTDEEPNISDDKAVPVGKTYQTYITR